VFVVGSNKNIVRLFQWESSIINELLRCNFRIPFIIFMESNKGIMVYPGAVKKETRKKIISGVSICSEK